MANLRCARHRASHLRLSHAMVRCLTPLLLTTAAGIFHKAAAEPAGGDDLSLEQLTSMEVSGVSKSAERLSNAPAAVTVVTSEDIQAYGFRTLADLLNAAPGFFTYSDRANSFVGVRGFAPVESFNSRVLLLIDGCPMNDNIFRQAQIGNDGLVDMNLIDRVEIIAGPSSSVYGTDAYLGVINVILKTPAQANTQAQTWAGSGDEYGALATLSAQASEDTHYLLQVSGMSSNGLDVVFPPQPGIPDGTRVSGVDGQNITRAFAKIISGNLRLNLSYSERGTDTGFGLYGNVMGEPSWLHQTTAFADLRYEGTLDGATDYALRASTEQFRYRNENYDPYGNLPGFPPVLPSFMENVGNWADGEATVTHHFSAHNRLIVGTQVRGDFRESLSYANSFQGAFLNAKTSNTLLGVYAQSDIDWTPHWTTSVGLRDDAGGGQNNRLNPRLALLWKPTSEQVLKLLYGSAFRDPSFFEQAFQQPPLNLPNSSLLPERIHTLDLVYQAQLTALVSLTATAFRYRADELITEVIGDPVTGALQYQNAAAARAQGGDLALDARLLPSLRARLSGEYVVATDATGDNQGLPNAPRWTARAGLDQRLFQNWHIAAEALFEDRRMTVVDAQLPAFVVANLSVSRFVRSGQPYFSLGLYNLFGRAYAQPVNGWQGDRVNQTGFTWRATIGYAF